jgi:uncharacterized protein (TIGR02246 family)
MSYRNVRFGCGQRGIIASIEGGAITVSTSDAATTGTGEEARVAELYSALIAGWNRRDAPAFASVFADDGSLIGFDGSDPTGRATIERELQAIFADHTPAQYVAKVRSIELLSPTVALLRAVVGMIPPETSDLKPERNAHQTLLTRKDSDEWQVVLFQNTPAAYDGRPELVKAMTEELGASPRSAELRPQAVSTTKRSQRATCTLRPFASSGVTEWSHRGR